jgi:flagellar biosynthetic protein FlhB
MTSGFDPRIDRRHTAWCGAALMTAAVLAPLFGWLAPLGFAPLVALAGVIGLKAISLERQDLPWAGPLLVMLCWAVLSILWSPYRPEDLEGWTALKLVLQAVVYWACVCAAGQAGPEARRRSLMVFAWGMAGLGAVFLLEGVSGALIYRTLRDLTGDPIRPDLAAKNVAQGGFILAVLWPVAALAAWRVGAPRWLGLVMVAGLAVSGFAFGSDAPILAVPLAAARAAAVAAIGWFGGRLLAGLADYGRYCLSGMGRHAGRDLLVSDVTALALASVGQFAVIVFPLASTTALVVIGMSLAQGGWVVASEKMKLDFTKLNPANGLKRLGLRMAWTDLLKTFVAVTIIAVLGYQAMWATVADADRLARLPPVLAFMAGWSGVDVLLRRAAIALILLAGLDYLLQRRRLMASLKMTKQEVKDEWKSMEGNPQVKAKIRGLQLQAARRRMLAAVPGATVVVTNPTHFAVALEYHRAQMPAPRVVAKGRGLLALRIKAIAREHGVPIVENVPLAQALYKTAEVGDTIPAALFEAVAEVLAYLIRLKQLVL